MAELVRVTVSLESDLLERFDRFCSDGRFATRSEAVRQWLHDRLAREAWESDDTEVSATLTMVYDHHKRAWPKNFSTCSTTTPSGSCPPCTCIWTTTAVWR